MSAEVTRRFAGPLASTSDQVYPAYPGNTDAAAAADLAGVPGLFRMSGQGDGGLPTAGLVIFEEQT